MHTDGGAFVAEDKSMLVKALEESNEILREQNESLQRRIKILRTTVRTLRSTVSDLRKTHEIAVKNDEDFRALCENGGELDSVPAVEGGLPESSLSGPAESTQ